MKDDLDWENLKVFRRLAHDQTARSAARNLGVHHATVTRRLNELEEDLGTRLFLRTSDGYALTESGKTLLEDVAKFDDRLLDLRREIHGLDKKPAGILRVTMTVPIFVHAFARRIVEFADAYPDLEVELKSGVGFLDIDHRGADVAIRMDNNPTESLIGKRLTTYFQAVYCSHDYAERTRFPEDPRRGRWLRWRQSEEEFPEWGQHEAFADMPRWGEFHDVTTLQEAARHGLGVALLPCLLGDSVDGLVRATDTPPTPGREIWILTHEDLRYSARVRAFMTFAEDVIRDLTPRISGLEPN